MRKIYFFLMLVSLVSLQSVFAQKIDSFQYQGIIRDNNGIAIPDKELSIKISICQDSIKGMTVFSEVHNAQTNNFGMVTLMIGGGTKITNGTLRDIEWGRYKYFMTIAVDFYNNGSFTEMGWSQLTSVPYAMFSMKSDSVVNEADPVFSLHPAAAIRQTDIENWNEAYSWGDHSNDGYVKISSIADSGQIIQWNGNEWVAQDLRNFTIPQDTTSKGGFPTAGSVLFSDGSEPTGDNANFYWNNTTKMLGLGLGASSPTNLLHVKGANTVRLESLSTSTEDDVLVVNSNGVISKRQNSFTSGTVTSIATTPPLTGGPISNTGTIGINKADYDTDGYLSSGDWNTFNNKLTSSLLSGKIFVGNSSNIATAVTMSGDASMINTGVLTLANTTVTSGTYGATGANIPNVSFDSKGRATNASNRSLTTVDINALNLNGGTMNGKLVTAKSVTSNAGINLPHGDSPSSPAPGDFWTTSTGLYVRIGNNTIGPLSSTTGTVTSVTANSPIIVSTPNTTPVITLGTVPIANGGTNNNAAIAANGAVAYSDGSKYNFSTVGTTGRAMISGGAGAPTWFAPTAGSIVFAGASGILAQNNANLFWKDDTKRLGIGNAAPLYPLHVTGDVGFTGTLQAGIIPVARISGTLPVANGGTGATSFTANSYLKGNGANAVTISATIPITDLTGTLPVTKGGTGTPTAPTQGGIIYATSASAFASTVAGTAGYLLKSNGTSAPSWLQTLPIANGGTNNSAAIAANGAIAYSDGSKYNFSTVGTSGRAMISGGAGAPTWFTPTAGSIVFAGASGVLSQNNANLFWKDDTKRLGIGNVAPLYPLHVTGDVGFTGTLQAGTVPVGRINSVVAGSTIISQGIGAAPIWGKIALTTHIQGILPIANGGTNNSAAIAANGAIAYSDGLKYNFSTVGTSGRAMISGGAGAPTWFAPTAGSIVFAGASGILAQNNANLFWKDDTKRLGIGNAAPLYPLHVTGDVGFTGTLQAGTVPVARIGGTLPVANGGTNNNAAIAANGAVAYSDGSKYNFSTVGTTGRAMISGGAGAPTWFAPTAGSIVFAGASGVLAQNNTSLFWNNTNKRLGIGNAAPSYPLHVTGDVGFTGTLQAGTVPVARISGTLPVANGGTGNATLAANKVIVGNGTTGVLQPVNLHWDNTNSRLGIGTAAPTATLSVGSSSQFQVAGADGKTTITSANAAAFTSKSTVATNGTGVIGVGNNLTAAVHTSGSGGAFVGAKYAIYGKATNTTGDRYGAYFEVGTSYAQVGGFSSAGTDYKIKGSGTVATTVEDTNGEPVVMFCPESPEILFTDYGTGRLENGRCRINLDEIFSNNIITSNDQPIKVFIQLEGDCNGVYVTNKSISGFDVVELQNGNSSVVFSWQVVANRKNRTDSSGNITSKHEGVRFPIDSDR